MLRTVISKFGLNSHELSNLSCIPIGNRLFKALSAYNLSNLYLFDFKTCSFAFTLPIFAARSNEELLLIYQSSTNYNFILLFLPC